MMSIDLLRQDKRWKEGLMDIRHIMADLVQKVVFFDHTLSYQKVFNLSEKFFQLR